MGTRWEAILKAYEEWDPDTETATELARRLGISRQRLYEVLGQHDITPKTRRSGVAGAPGDLLEEMAKHALEYLIEQLTEYRARYGPL